MSTAIASMEWIFPVLRGCPPLSSGCLVAAARWVDRRPTHTVALDRRGVQIAAAQRHSPPARPSTARVVERRRALEVPMHAVTMFRHSGELSRANPCPPEQLNDTMATGAAKDEIQRKGRKKQGNQSH